MYVRFDKNGFYHPAFGRMGQGRRRGDVYKLPDDIFAAEGALPSTAEVLDVSRDELQDILADHGQSRVHTPVVIDEEQHRAAVARSKRAKRAHSDSKSKKVSPSLNLS